MSSNYNLLLFLCKIILLTLVSDLKCSYLLVELNVNGIRRINGIENKQMYKIEKRMGDEMKMNESKDHNL